MGYKVSGTVTVGGSPAAKKVLAIDRDNDVVLGSSTSDAGTGAFTVGWNGTAGSTGVLVVAVDASYNAVPFDMVVPIAIYDSYYNTVIGDSPVNYWRLGDGVDPHYANVSLLLPMHGDNNGTSFVDQSPTPKTVTRYGNAITSTAQSKFYGSSAYFDGTGDYLSLADSAAWSLGTGDFSIEAWVYLDPPGAIAARTICSQQNTPTESANSVVFYLGVSASNYNGLVLKVSSGGSASYLSAGYSFATGQWYHVAVSRSSGVVRFFVNGTQTGSNQTFSDAINDSTAALMVGRWGGQSFDFIGYMQDFRYTKGAARYTATFTPPSRLSRWAIDELNVHHLTWAGTPVYGTTGAIVSDTDTAMTLDGSTEYATKTVADYRGGDSHGTVECWFKVGTIITPAVLFGYGDGDGNSRFFIAAHQDGYLYVVCQDTTGTENRTRTTSTGHTDGQWHHFCLTSSGASYSIYVDGYSEPLTVINGSNNGRWFADSTDRDKLALGVLIYTSTIAHFPGTLDEVAVYDYPLTAAQVVEHYNTGIA